MTAEQITNTMLPVGTDGLAFLASSQRIGTMLGPFADLVSVLLCLSSDYAQEF